MKKFLLVKSFCQHCGSLNFVVVSEDDKILCPKCKNVPSRYNSEVIELKL